MSAEMRDFAAAFNKGLDRGVGMAQKREDQAIQREHNKLLQDQHQATARNADRRTDIYAESVKSAAETNRIRAQAALNKGSGRGGGVAAAAPNPDKYAEGAAGVGLAIPKPQAPPAPTIINQTYQSTSDDAPATPVNPPGDGYKKGGMVKKYADGGMTVAEALSYGPRTGGSESKPKETPASTFESSFKKAAEAAAAKKPADTIKNAAPKPTGPVGTGPAGSYTTQDVRPGGVLDTTSVGISGTDYRRGGKVRKFAGGGAADLSDPEAAVKSMAYTPADKNPDGSSKTKDQEDEGTIAKTARAATSSGIDWSTMGGAGGSADGATGDSSGSATGEAGSVGGATGAGTGGESDGGTGGGTGGTYSRGGRVRRFQSGGRVMEAIDTGTSGPGSGFGYRAAPPSRRY